MPSMDHDNDDTSVVETPTQAEGHEGYWARRTGGPVQRHFPPAPTAEIPTEAPGLGQRFSAPSPVSAAPAVAAAPAFSPPPSAAADEADAPIPAKTHERRKSSIVNRIAALAGGVVPSEPRTQRQLRA
jgi:hypothetical protein